MLKQGKKFEHEVHLGFLVIVFVLLLLNVVANYVVYRARATQHETWSSQFGTAALAASREVAQQWPAQLTNEQIARLTGQYELTGIVVVRSQPQADSLEARREWFASVVWQLPHDQVPQFVEKLILSDYSRVTRGSKNEYFFVYPTAGAGGSLVILSANIPELAFLDDSANVLLYFGLGALALVTLVYLVLSRYIFSPFRRIKAEALKAGRSVDLGDDDAEALVAEYRSIIRELQRNETELRRLNDEITRRADSLEHLHQSMLRSMQIGLVTLNARETVIEVNEVAARMLGTDDSAVGRRFEDVVPNLEPLHKSARQALQAGVVGGYRELAVGAHMDRRTATWGVTLSLIKDQDDKLMGLSIWMADISELVQLRGEVESKNRLAALGEMASGLAHQLRNSLGAISGYGTLVKKRLVKAEIPVDQAESLLDESRQAESLISRFLTFARPFDYSPTGVRLDDLLVQIVESFTVRDDCRLVTVETDLRAKATIAADALLLKQAIGNLLDNAANAYADRRGVIRVTSTLQNGGVSICIADEGEGIAADKLDRIFTPFYSSRSLGTGLGLPLVRKIVDLHQGRITVESAEGRGTRFTLIFPVAEYSESVSPSLHSTR